ncbi:3'-5' exonuclease family protein [Noviherbaspirillum massiliense]|uniref:3'-5' exonuclease family protein n=1 Tax=Noviherbaspirillum massiliense TaxID=1465823 RepID=UPI0002F94536|nr:3'-5' exonuclease family protein [Noviherbaspirillum massiliense]
MLTHFDKYIFIDLETTGPEPLKDLVTEIGMVVATADGVTRWSTLVNPEVPIPPFIQNLTGITDEMVQHAPTFAAIADELRQRLEGGLFIAHNARFDYGFLRHAFRRIGQEFRCDVLCTVKLSRRLFPQEIKHGLDALVERHELEADGRHRALADADLLWQLWRKLEATVAPHAFSEALEFLMQRPSISVHLAPERLDDVPDGPGVYLFYGEGDMPLYVGKATHLRPRVLAHVMTDQGSDKDRQLAQQIRRIDWHETAGETGAALLEVELARDLQPQYGRHPNRPPELCSWQLCDNGDGWLRPVLRLADEFDFGRAERMYGLFASPAKAEMALRALAEKQGLCLALLGLESRTSPEMPCSARQAGQCHGACVGQESAEQHGTRLEQALVSLKLVRWPYAGAGVVTEDGADGRCDLHLVDNWHYLGTTRSELEVPEVLAEWRRKMPADPTFDFDTYKILTRALSTGQVRLQALDVIPGHDALPSQDS